MATRKSKKAARRTSSESKVTVDRGESRNSSSRNDNFLDRIQNDLEKNQSYLNLILGALIVVVLGVLVFNYFNKPTEEVGNITPEAQVITTDEAGDVTKEALPGKYTVKEGDTLFTIAQKYYDDGYKYSEIITENNLPGESIEVGQELTIPKLEDALAAASADPSASPDTSASPEASPSPETAMASPSPEATPQTMAEAASPAPAATPAAWGDTGTGTGGAENQTVWGEAIKNDTYTVQAGDWLSKIAGRAYGDITRYNAIAQANNIQNPDNIEVGMVLKIPRN